MVIKRRERRGVLLLASVFVMAGAGLAYQLISGTMATYLLGQSVTQFSFATGWFLASMGIGSYLSRNTRVHLVETFVLVQCALALIGGFSAMLMFWLFAETETLYPIFLTLALLIGGLIGLEIPLVLRILGNYRISRLAIADVFTWDYIGALAASLFFPLIVLPGLGLIRSALFFGAWNTLAAALGWSIVAPSRRRALNWLLGVTIVMLAAGFVFAERLTRWIENELYQDPIVLTRTTPYQRIVVTRWKDDTRLYLDGNLQFSSRDEARYHESITHVPISFLARDPERVLILGGGDGLVARELLRYPTIRQVTIVDLDEEMVRLFKEDRVLRGTNESSLLDARVKVIIADAFSWLKTKRHDTPRDRELYDLIIADLPDPNNHSLGKLYTVTFYLSALARLAPDGAFVTQATSPMFAAEAFWSIRDTLAESCARSFAGACVIHPYHLYVPSFGDWGFVLVGRRGRIALVERRRPLSVPTRFLTAPVIPTFFVFARDLEAKTRGNINRLNNQVLVGLYDRGWDNWYE